MKKILYFPIALGLLTVPTLLAGCAGGGTEPTTPPVAEPHRQAAEAGPASATTGGGDAAAVSSALARARGGELPYRLLVNCADDEHGIRAFDLFPGGVAIWNGDTQVEVPPAMRRALAGDLLDAGFPALETVYGGKRPPPAEAGADEAGEAPLTVSCRVTFRADGVEKTSAQQIYGEQSATLTGLGHRLLDRVEPLAADGTGADDLADGLAKLAAGELAPQAFELRFVALPPDGADGGGSIVRIADGRISRRPYAPGESVGEASSEEMSEADHRRIVEALRAADFAALPGNLWAEGRLEVEVRVLDHHRTVLARSFRGSSRDTAGATQERFDALVEVLRSLT